MAVTPFAANALTKVIDDASLLFSTSTVTAAEAVQYLTQTWKSHPPTPQGNWKLQPFAPHCENRARNEGDTGRYQVSRRVRERFFTVGHHFFVSVRERGE